MTSYRELRKVEDKRDIEALATIGRVAAALTAAQERAIAGNRGSRMRQIKAANTGEN